MIYITAVQLQVVTGGGFQHPESWVSETPDY